MPNILLIYLPISIALQRKNIEGKVLLINTPRNDEGVTALVIHSADVLKINLVCLA